MESAMQSKYVLLLPSQARPAQPGRGGIQKDAVDMSNNVRNIYSIGLRFHCFCTALVPAVQPSKLQSVHPHPLARMKLLLPGNLC